MTKSGLKTFVCSFILSLFLIFSINGVLLHENQYDNNIKIPQQNITLFLKKENSSVKPVKTLEIKKISLSLPNGKVKKQEIITENADEIEQKNTIPAEPKEVVVADINIPLQKSERTIKKQEKTANEPEQIPLTKNKPEPKEIVVASLPVEISKTKNKQIIPQQEPVLPIIPLEKGNIATKDLNKEIEVASKAPKDNYVALSDANTPIASMKTEKKETSNNENKHWVSMKDKKAQNNEPETPWVMAKAGNHPANELLKQEKFFKEAEENNKKIKKVIEAEDPIKSRIHLTNDYKVQLASKTMDNIIIPIPKEILEDENLTPKLVSSDDPKSKEKEAELTLKHKDETIEKSEEDGIEKSLLDSLNSIFSSTDSNVRPKQEEKEDEKETFAEKASRWKKTLKQKRQSRILPIEMRLAFQPGRAEISGQTLKWIRAFADKAKKDETTALEIRINGTNFQELQQKRLTLLSNILAHDGVIPEKVNTIFTDREPNSFIIRTIKVNNKPKFGATRGNKPVSNSRRYQHW